MTIKKLLSKTDTKFKEIKVFDHEDEFHFYTEKDNDKKVKRYFVYQDYHSLNGQISLMIYTEKDKLEKKILKYFKEFPEFQFTSEYFINKFSYTVTIKKIEKILKKLETKGKIARHHGGKGYHIRHNEE